ncbi:hypothetical protein [Pseudarthrobacter sp. AB1]|uniref:hypothetical protein n=1 Tax=Pseudarthrobacter sp. AB1 TaxID=2138309 RepID=UPI00186B87B5|nr:hypothetical protein [Pseudarthrobacter sp. AB1]MBE4719860.1 hypothetical protein [Pseudarthrobacter sp. AB1]
MNIAPSPSSIDVIIHDAEAEWWQIVAALGPLVVLCAVLIAAIGWVALRRRTAAINPGNRSDWWPRAQWALEACLDDPKRREVGFAALELLNTSNLSGKEESRIIAEAWKSPLRDRETMSALAEKKTVDGSHLQSGIGPDEERVVVRAARLRLSTDKKLGIESTSWVKAVAKRPL